MVRFVPCTEAAVALTVAPSVPLTVTVFLFSVTVFSVGVAPLMVTDAVVPNDTLEM